MQHILRYAVGMALVVLFSCSSTSLYAKDSTSQYLLRIDIPVADLPFNIDASRSGLMLDNFSMQQSLAITQNFHNTNYYLSNKLWHRLIRPDTRRKQIYNRIAANLTSGLVDYVFTYHGVVFSPQWLHEEFHRTGLTIRGIRSYDETYNFFNGGLANGSISRVKDEDLARFKKEAPQELVRSFAAGVESEYLLLRNFQKDNFFRKGRYPNILMNILLTNHAVGYVNQFRKKDYNNSIDSMNHYGSEISDRDYVGWDFTPWVYDLHRPDEPYEARGIHPSGKGIDRAIKTTKLTPQEYKYLEKMGKMQYLNFITPFMIGIDRIRINDHTAFNFAVRHYLNSFGYDLTVDLFLEHKNKQYLLTIHKYTNSNMCLPGIELEYPAFGFTWKERKVQLFSAAMVWLQPESFYSKKAVPGGMLSAKGMLELNSVFDIYAIGEVKSGGWVAGNPYLDSNWGLRMGVTASFR